MNKRNRCRPSLLAMLLALPALQASAQVSPAFEKVLASPSEQQMVLAAARRSAVVEENSCADGRFVIASKVAIYEAPVFDQAGLLRSGVWKQVVEYTGCNSPRSLNVLVTVAQNQRPNARPLFPGDTMADPKLQSDVFLGGAMRLMVDRWRDPACRNVYVVDTQVQKVEPPIGAGARTPTWSETWTIAACERRQKVRVQFGPQASGDGVTYVISAA